MNMMNNPAMMQQMETMMKNPEIQKMMSDPNILNNLGSMMNQNNNEKNDDNDYSDSDDEPITVQNDNLNSDLNSDLLNTGDNVILQNLKNDSYNNKKGVVNDYNQITERYTITLNESNKNIAIKPENVILDIN